MNKDVIYIEPEDDITDIITKLENSKEKIVALVPPKKAGVFRSIVNIKLIAKTANSIEKTVVLVTTDPSIVKLAAATRIPVTKNLQSAPVIPESNEDGGEEVEVEEVVETTNKDGEEEVVAEKIEVNEDELDNDTEEEEEDKKEGEKEDSKNDDKKPAKDKKKKSADKKFKNPVLGWIVEHKKISIGCGIGLVLLILVLVWAIAIAPAATITLGIRTTTSNFSENVSFTDKLSDENVNEGKFYLVEKKIESKAEKEFEATGSKNVGEKATGSLIIYFYFNQKGPVAVNAGDKFTIGDLVFTADSDSSLTWNGSLKNCENYKEDEDYNGISDEHGNISCRISGHINVTATEPGEKYNIAPSTNSWRTVSIIEAASDTAMSGGTDKIVTVVQQSDIDKATADLKTDNESVNKEKLLDTIDDDNAFVIEDSFKQTTGNAVSTPALGEVVEDGKKAKLTVVTTDTIYIIDKTKVIEFITEKAKLADNYKIYSMNDPFIENFTNTESGYVGKLKASYVSGPKVTENDVVDMVRGKGVGTAQHDLKDAFDGISSIDIRTSFPWVSSIPNDANKITVVMNVEE